MTAEACATDQQCVIIQETQPSPKWIEIGHGVESWMTVAGLVVAAIWAYRTDWLKLRSEARAERKLREHERLQRQDQVAEQQRNREWEQSKLAREINEQFINDPLAKVATDLIDYDGDIFEAREKDRPSGDPYKYDFGKKQDVEALRIFADHETPEKGEAFLRTCFDAWFYWMAAMEQYLQNELIRQKDMAFPSDYYLRYLRKDERLYGACIEYVTRYQLSRKVVEFMARFEKADGEAAGAATEALLSKSGSSS